LPGSLPAKRTRPHHWRSQSTQSGPCRLGVANESHKLATGSGSNCLILCVLTVTYPKGVELNPVLPRDGSGGGRPTALRSRKSLVRGLVHQTPHPPPRTRVGWAAPHPGVVGEPAAGCIPSVPPVGGWGRLGPSSWPQIRRWDRRRCCRRISGPPGGPEIRWVLAVGCCPSKRVVIIHHARSYTAQKASGGCVRAISGNRSCLRRMHSLRHALALGLCD
jgi:hypothetical protein